MQSSQPDSTPPRRGKEPGVDQWYRLAGIGVEFVLAMLIPGAIGWWLDGMLGTRPWLMLGLGLVGFAVGLWLMIRTAMRQFHD